MVGSVLLGNIVLLNEYIYDGYDLFVMGCVGVWVRYNESIGV